MPTFLVCMAAAAGCADAPDRTTAGVAGISGAGGTGGPQKDAEPDEGPDSAGSAGSAPKDGAPVLPAIQRSLVRGAPDWPQSGFNEANVSSSTARVTDLPASLWSTPLDVGDLAYAVPVVGGGKLFVRLCNGGLAALDSRTGAVEWWVKDFGPGAGFDGKCGASADEDGLVLTFAPQGATFSDSVIALDASTGSVAWVGPAVQTNGIKVVAGTVFVTGASQIVADGRVIVGSARVLDAETGEVVAEFPQDCMGWAAPVAIDGMVCSGRQGGSTQPNVVCGISGPALGEPIQ